MRHLIDHGFVVRWFARTAAITSPAGTAHQVLRLDDVWREQFAA
jgi:hypothetical protein